MILVTASTMPVNPDNARQSPMHPANTAASPGSKSMANKTMIMPDMM